MSRPVEHEPPVIVWGRCRDASRWFWTTHLVGGEDRYGWAVNRNEAAAKANRAAVLLASGQYASIRIDDTVAEAKFAAVTAEKQARAKAESKQRAAAGDGPLNLYAVQGAYFDFGSNRVVPPQVVRLPVVKTTPKRIFFLLSTEPGEFERGSIDRQAFEAQGWVYSSRFRKIYATPPELPKGRPFIPPPFPPEYTYPRVTVTVTDEELKRLKAIMRAAHPDLGGTNEAFIKARADYERARNLTHR